MYTVTVRTGNDTQVSPDFGTRLEACRHYAELIAGYDVVRTVEYCRGNYELVLRNGGTVLINIIDLDEIEV